MTSSAPRRSSTKVTLRAAALLAAAAALLTACPSNQSADPPASTTTTQPDVANRLGEVRRFLNDALLTAEASKLVDLTSGPARQFAQFQATLESIGDYKARTGGGSAATSANVDGVTAVRREGDRIVVEGEATSEDEKGEETKLTDIELVEEGGAFKLFDFRFSRSGLKASQMVVEGGDTTSNSDIDAKVLGAACFPPGSITDEAVLQLNVEYTATGAKPVRLRGADVKPPATPAVNAEDGWSDTSRPNQKAVGSVLFVASAFDGATATLEFEDEDGEDVPNIVVGTPEFPDARACRTEVAGGGTTGTTRGSGTTRSTRTTRSTTRS